MGELVVLSRAGSVAWMEDALKDSLRRMPHGTKSLETRLSLDGFSYYISWNEIRAASVRLALKYPGLWQSRPESIERLHRR
jgi:hypothetical protein